MDKEVLNGLSDFERVWRRVNGAPAPEGMPSDDADTLRALMDDEARDGAFYLRTARRASGVCRGVLLRNAADEKRHLRLLQTEYFLLTGDSYAPKTPEPEALPLLTALRGAFIGENNGAAEYETAASRTGRPELRELYEANARDERAHAAALRRLIENAM